MATTKSHPMSLAISPPGLYSSPLGDVTLTNIEAGKLVMPTGLLRGRDLFVAAGGFSVALAPGTYPVTLVTAQLKDRRLPRAYSGRRIAYAVLRVSESKPVNWSHARHDGDDEGYCVDSWYGCFMDDQASRLMEARFNQGNPMNYEKKIRSEFKKSNGTACPWVNHRPDASSDANVIGFFSGLGSGVYPTYVGRNARKGVAAVVTDFLYLQGIERPIIEA